ncbi:MAG: type II toxin-antitoxin system PemK/MazF family toxin [Gemmatimonadaceae bacterium]|nr:type II toxin-antitoxin system PemK/MazF family toxin [Gemmatimonadaceae bacterium]
MTGKSAGRVPLRGEVWQVELRPARGREQDGQRPAMIVSVDKFNRGASELVIVIPITKVNKQVASHVPVPRGEAGMEFDSYIKVEDIRSVSKERLVRYRGDLTWPRIEAVQRILRVLLDI